MATGGQAAQSDRGIRGKLERLHSEGVVNLDAPLREAIPELARRVQKTHDQVSTQRAEAVEAIRTEWYCLVGDEGFICYIKWEW
jgi:hypothetical protein